MMCTKPSMRCAHRKREIFVFETVEGQARGAGGAPSNALCGASTLKPGQRQEKPSTKSVWCEDQSLIFSQELFSVDETRSRGRNVLPKGSHPLRCSLNFCLCCSVVLSPTAVSEVRCSRGSTQAVLVY